MTLDSPTGFALRIDCLERWPRLREGIVSGRRWLSLKSTPIPHNEVVDNKVLLVSDKNKPDFSKLTTNEKVSRKLILGVLRPGHRPNHQSPKKSRTNVISITRETFN